MYNYLSGLAFEIQCIDSEGKVQVAVSRLFKCHESQGTLVAIISQAVHSLGRVDAKKDLPSLLQKCASVISSAANAHMNGMGGDSPSQNDASSIQAKNNSSRDDRPPKKPKTSGKSPGDRAHLHRGVNYKCSGKKGEDGKTGLLYHTGLEEHSMGSLVTTCEADRFTQLDLQEIFMQNKGVLAVGSSGVVVLGIWGNTKLAIKSWNTGRSNL